MGKPNAGVISVQKIWQGCYLVPHFGSGHVPAAWKSDNVLDLATHFLLDKYLDLFLFEEYEQSLHC